MKKLIYLFIAFSLLSCGAETKEENAKQEEKKAPEEISEATSDIEPESETVKIGEIEFAARNLDVIAYRNGDIIPQAKDSVEWEKFAEKKEGCWAYPDFKEENGSVYGLLYNGYTISDKRGLAPVGWKIPDYKIWNKLITELGGDKIAGKKVKSTTGWKVNGDNSSGFNALPGGFIAGGFGWMGERAYFWSAGEPAPEYHNHYDLYGDKDEFSTWYDHDSWGLYVRCVKE